MTMLNAQTISGVIQQSAAELIAAHPDLSAHIAVRVADIDVRIAQVLQQRGDAVANAAFCFELCHSLEDIFQTDDTEIRQQTDVLRRNAQRILLQKHYDAERTAHPERILQIAREESVSGVIADAVQILRTSPSHVFGPEWFRFELGKDAYDALCEYAYDLEKDTIQWDMIASLLPSDLRSSFDTTEIGDIPDVIETDDQFDQVIAALERRGIKREDLLDAAQLAGHIRDVPGFQALLDYCERKAQEDND